MTYILVSRQINFPQMQLWSAASGNEPPTQEVIKLHGHGLLLLVLVYQPLLLVLGSPYNLPLILCLDVIPGTRRLSHDLHMVLLILGSLGD